MGEEGEYVPNGDVMEWHWNPGYEPTKFGGIEPDFDPTSAPLPEPSVAESEAEVEEEDDLESLTKEELQDELAERGLPTSGNKPDLIERLRA
jgi:hypothetical protein